LHGVREVLHGVREVLHGVREVLHGVREVCGHAGGHVCMCGGQGWGDVCSRMEEVGCISTIDTHLFIMPKASIRDPKHLLASQHIKGSGEVGILHDENEICVRRYSNHQVV